jgi:hypothetical protein
MTFSILKTEAVVATVTPPLAAFVEAAFNSETPITVKQLLEMVEEEIQAKLLYEGILKAQAGQVVDNVKGIGTELAGWFQSVDEKTETTLKKCDELIDWLKEEDKDSPNLSLVMGGFMTWMKTSEWNRWRYYFFLNDSVFSGIMKDIKAGNTSELEGMTDLSLDKRKKAAKALDNAKTVKDLIKIVETYKSRAKQFFTAIRGEKTRGAPFQVVLLGYVDLESSVKKIVRLAK